MKTIFTLLIFSLIAWLPSTGAPKLSSPASADFAQLRCNLFQVMGNGSTILLDGNLTQYDSTFTNAIDGMDALKMSNPSENWGILRNNYTLAIERRHSIVNTDSIFFKMLHMHLLNYEIDVMCTNLDKPGRTGLLQDKYLNTATLIYLNDTTRVRFTVTADPASGASDRFRIIFTAPYFSNGLLPITFTGVKGLRQNNNNLIEWNTANETNVSGFTIERSPDGILFEKASVAAPKNLAFNSYSWTDPSPYSGNNYYRIHSTDIDGQVNYSNIIKIGAPAHIITISVFPNPVIGNNLNISFNGQPAGTYQLRLFNGFGQAILEKSVTLGSVAASSSLHPATNLARGVYRLQVKTPAGDTQEIPVVF